MEKLTLSQSLIATKRLEDEVSDDFFRVVEKYDDEEITSRVNNMSLVILDVMSAMRHKLIKLEHELNTIIEKREEEDAKDSE